MTFAFRCVAVFAAFVGIVAPLESAVFDVQFPLSGRHLYGAAKGSVTFRETIGETSRTDGTVLIIEVSNVPLPAGTELIVNVHEREIGRLTLNKQRSGRLVMESGFRNSVPRIKAGSFVTLKLDDGSVVVW